ncbi:MAG TPA: hypothetical protein VH415_09210 [Nitrososphaeraceae archaeon]|jgi:hypothetical protein
MIQFRLQEYILLIVYLCACCSVTGVPITNYAYAHFYGATKNINGYQIIFSPYPTVPLARDNSTLINLSLLDENNKNVNNISASLVIKEKDSGQIVKSFPLKPYEFSDITIPFTFPKEGDYIVTVEFKINGDPVYGKKPLKADFDLPAANPNQLIPLDELIIYYVIPASIAIAGVTIYLRRKGKI